MGSLKITVNSKVNTPFCDFGGFLWTVDGKVPQIKAANDPHLSLDCNSKVPALGDGAAEGRQWQGVGEETSLI